MNSNKKPGKTGFYLFILMIDAIIVFYLHLLWCYMNIGSVKRTISFILSLIIIVSFFLVATGKVVTFNYLFLLITYLLASMSVVLELYTRGKRLNIILSVVMAFLSAVGFFICIFVLWK